MTWLSLAPASLHRLRRRLLLDGPGTAAGILEDAGFATGNALTVEWNARVVAGVGVRDPGALDVSRFGPLLGELVSSLGWGSLAMASVADRALLLSSTDWAEAEPGSTEHPGCYFSCGCFAAFLTAQAGAPLAVLEVECRSSGGRACRFLAGSAETLKAVYDVLAAGRDWREAFPPADRPG